VAFVLFHPLHSVFLFPSIALTFPPLFCCFASENRKRPPEVKKMKSKLRKQQILLKQKKAGITKPSRKLLGITLLTHFVVMKSN